MPPIAAASCGALLAGGVEAMAQVHGVPLRAASAAFATLGLWPAVALVLVLLRFASAGWRGPAAQDDAAAQRNAATKLAAGAVAISSVAWLGYCAWLAVLWSAARTAFVPRTLALLVPGAVIFGAIVVAALAWPTVRALRAALLALDERWRARRGRPLLTHRRVLSFFALALALGLGAATWISSPLWSTLDTSVLAPLAPAAGAVVVAALLWRRAERLLRGRVGRVAIGLGAAACAWAIVTRVRDPVRVLDAWSEPTFAAEVIGQLFNPAALRAGVVPASAKPVAVPGAAHPDVILITIDTLRADRTPIHGGPAMMPALAQLATSGAVMTRAYAPGNVTRRSLPSLAIGMSPTRVRGKPHGWALEIDPRHVLLAERFAAAGYHTAGVFCCRSFWARELALGLDRGITEMVIDPAGAVLAQRAADLLRARRGASAPLFLWIHLLEPHQWNGGGAFAPPPAEARERYDAALTATDALLGRVLREVDLSRQVVVVTSDHGEGLGDHGAPFHGTNLSSSQLHVPLVFAGPTIRRARHDEVTGLIDLAPTLLALAGFAPPVEQLEGRSLAELLRGQRASDSVGGEAYAAMIRDRTVTENRSALIRGRWKLLRSPHGYELYDLVEDPGESRNLAGTAPVFAELQRLLRERAARDRSSPFAPLSR